MRILTFFIIILCGSAAEKLKVCVTVPDMANLCMAVGGQEVEVSTLVLPAQSPHLLKSKPINLVRLKEAQLFIKSGFELEAAWLPKLLQECGNKQIQAGQQAHLDPSSIIKPIVTGRGTFTRLTGRGQVKVNPHYLLDPVNALLTAQLICSRLKTVKPEKTTYFNERRSNFQMNLWTKLIGHKMAAAYDSAKLTKLIKRGKLEETIISLSKEVDIGGWLGKMKHQQGQKYIVDYHSYAYFFRRFGLVKLAALKPSPNALLNDTQLEKLKNSLEEKKVAGLVTNPWFSRNIITKFLANAPFKEIKLAHQSLDLKGGESYIKMIGENVEKLMISPNPRKLPTSRKKNKN